MKRFASFMLLVVLTLSLFAVPVSAIDGSEDIDIISILREYGYSESDMKDLIVGVITDLNGNIISVDISRNLYYTGEQITIPAYSNYICYQYYTSKMFYAGFYFSHSTYGNPATTTGKTINIQVRKAASVGGTRTAVSTVNYSTNQSDNPNYDSDVYGPYIMTSVYADSTMPYYDAKYTNLSSESIVVSRRIGKD